MSTLAYNMLDSAQTRSAVSIFVICLSLSPPLWRLTAITKANKVCLALYRYWVSVSLSHLQFKVKKKPATIRNASTVIFALRNGSLCICPYDLQQKPTHFLEGPLQEVRYSHQDPFHWIPSGSKDSWLGRAGNAMIRGASVLSTIVHHSRPVAMQIWWRMQMYTHRASKTAVYNSHGVIFARAGLRWLVKRIN